MLTALAFAGCGGRAQVEPQPSAPAPTGALLGVVSSIDGSTETLFSRVTPVALRPRSPRVHLGEYHDAWSFSPDRSRVAFAISASAKSGGGRVGVRIVDVARMRVVRDVSTGIAAQAIGWLGPRKLVALLQSGEVNVIDPVTGDVLHRRALGHFKLQCVPQPSAVTRRGLVLLLASRGRKPTRLVLVSAQGSMRTVSLPRIAVGGDCGRGGLAVDDAGERAFAVGRGSLVANVNLRTMQATYHRVGGLRSADARRRGALWLGDGLLVAFGHDTAGAPVGVEVIDTTAWTSRVIHADAGGARPFAGGLVVFDGRLGSPTRRGIGLRAYRPDGSPLFHALGREKVWNVQIADGNAYARTSTALHVVDLDSSKVIEESKPGGLLTEIVKGP